MKFPTMEEMAKDVAEKALDEYIYEGKTIRQWVEILKDYDDKKTTLERIVERLEKYNNANVECRKVALSRRDYDNVIYFQNLLFAIEQAIEIVKEEGAV